MKSLAMEETPRIGGGEKGKGWAGGGAGVQHEGSRLALGMEPSGVKGGIHGGQLNRACQAVSYGRQGKRSRKRCARGSDNTENDGRFSQPFIHAAVRIFF